MSDGFRVDLAALQQAAQGVHDSLTDIQRKSVSTIGNDATNVGHDRLAETVTDFCGSWDAGIQHLATDARGAADQLSGCIKAYREADQVALDHLNEILAGPD
jgi:hypothetical protein